MHEIRNVDALARTARMGSSSVNSTLTAPLAPCHGRTRWCLVETKVKDPGNNVSIATSTSTPSAPCTRTTTSWMLPSLNDGYHLAHTFNNWLDLYLVLVDSCLSVSGLHHGFVLHLLYCLDKRCSWFLWWHDAVENKCITIQPCVAHPTLTKLQPKLTKYWRNTGAGRRSMTEWRPMSNPARQCMTVPDIVGWLNVTECRRRATDCDVTPTQRNALFTEADKTLGQAGFLRVCVRSMGVAIRLDLRHRAMQFGWCGLVLGQNAILACRSRFLCMLKVCRGQKMFSRSLCVSWGFSTSSFGQCLVDIRSIFRMLSDGG